ncbi:hypothetical protein F4781DRAFT_441160 [Annulohypoxylon bovei var. microspora]|nr:hypothetical protein F4781DRAFT_441160 [Annulohypoxylon bovei var. microspora]
MSYKSKMEGPEHISSQALVLSDSENKNRLLELTLTYDYLETQNSPTSTETHISSPEEQNIDHASTKPQEFHLFKQLPAELRIQIWKMAAEPKLKEIFELQQLDSNDPLPQDGKLAVFKVKMDRNRMNVAQTCYESWEILQGNPQSTDWPLTPMRTYIYPSLDSLMLHSDIQIDGFWMTPEQLIGNAQHLIINPDEDFALSIIDDISESTKLNNNYLSSIKSMSIVIESLRLPVQANALVRERLSAQVPLVIDLDDAAQIKTMAKILDDTWCDFLGPVYPEKEKKTSSFVEECAILRNKSTHCCSDIRQRIQDNMAAESTVDYQDQKLPEIKRVMLLVDAFDKTPNIAMLLPYQVPPYLGYSHIL